MVRPAEGEGHVVREPDRWVAVILAAFILATGFALTVWSVGQEERQLRSGMLTEAQIAVQALDAGTIGALTGSPADLASPEYRRIKAQLARIRAANPAVRFTYLVGQRPDGEIFFYADSEPEDSPDVSPPGQVYTEATTFIRTGFSTRQALTGGPETDRWGTWVSSVVPVTDTETGRFVALFGMDIDAKDWNRKLATAGIPAVLGTILILVLIVSFSIVYRRNKRERLRIRESENVYRSLFEYTGTATIQIEEDATISIMNGTAEQMTGYSRGEIEGRRKWTDFVHPADLPQMAEYHRRRRKPGEQVPGQYEFRLVTRDGTQKDVLVTVGLIPGTTKSIASLFDLTEKKTLERAVKESEGHYRQLFELANDGITIVRDGLILQCNPALAAIAGYPVEDLIGQPLAVSIHPDDLALVMDRHRRRLSGEQGLPEVYTFRLVRKDGTIRWVELNTRLIEWKGKPATLNIVRDIAGRKAAQEALALANQKLNLLSDVTRHDVLNQLLVLQGLLSLSEEYLHDTEKLRLYHARELAAVAVIERQILFTKDYQNMGIKAPVWQNLHLILLHAKGSLPLRDVTLVQEGCSVDMLADPLFEKVFYNLIDNSLRHGGTKLTGIRISAREREDGLAITVEDDGEGIPADDKPRLFLRGVGKNTGFGLFLSREILAITGITIKEESEPGKGARFTILVPKGAYRPAGSGDDS